MIADSIALAGKRLDEAMFDAEHFFDGYKANPAFALDCLKAAYGAGARWVVLCDTNGGALPDEVFRIVSEVAQHIPGAHLGIHAHNDTENAVANSLAAVEAGARQVQGTINGLGERCGNANLISLIPTLALKTDYEIGISPAQMERLTSVSHMLDELLNRSPDRSQAYVGEAAFSHKAACTSRPSRKTPDLRAYRPGPGRQPPAHRGVGPGRPVQHSGASADAGIEIAADNPKIGRLVEDVKAREHGGYAYDGAEASFELLARKLLQGLPKFFTMESFRVETERRYNARGSLTTVSTAVTKLDVAGAPYLEAGEGNGPVDALDDAMRKALLRAYPELADMRLTDYKVRILTPQEGTAAVTRVMIESTDGSGLRWSTVGISPNIIEASYEALRDAIYWKLLRHADGRNGNGRNGNGRNGNGRNGNGRNGNGG